MTWKEWLYRENCYMVIEACAMKLEIHLYDKFPDSIPSVADLWDFCKERADDWERKHPFSKLIAQGKRAVFLFIVNSYERHLKDRLRNQPGIKYLYARYRKVLHEDSAFRTWSKAQLTYYTLDPSVPEDNELVRYFWNDFAKVGFPSDVSTTNLHKKKSLLEVARFFWEGVSEMEGSQQIWLPILDLVRYTASFIPVEQSFLSLGRGDKKSGDEDDIEYDLHEDDLLVEGDSDRIEGEFLKSIGVKKTMSDVRKLAKQCAARFSDKEKKGYCPYSGCRTWWKQNFSKGCSSQDWIWWTVGGECSQKQGLRKDKGILLRLSRSFTPRS